MIFVEVLRFYSIAASDADLRTGHAQSLVLARLHEVLAGRREVVAR